MSGPDDPKTFSQRREQEFYDYIRDRFFGGKGVVRGHDAGDCFSSAEAEPGTKHAVVLCAGPHDQVAAVRAKADDLFGGATVSSLTYGPDRHRATFHIADERTDLVGWLCLWVIEERGAGRLGDVRLFPMWYGDTGGLFYPILWD